jgi:hypothetical protein
MSPYLQQVLGVAAFDLERVLADDPTFLTDTEQFPGASSLSRVRPSGMPSRACTCCWTGSSGGRGGQVRSDAAGSA